MHNNNHKGRASTLSKALLTAGLLGIAGYGNAANAAPCPSGSKCFYNQKIVVSADPQPPQPPTNHLKETFIFDLETEDFLTTITRPGYTNPGTATPTDPSNSSAVRTDSNPLLTSEQYTFTGYKIKKILNGKVYTGGGTSPFDIEVYTGDIKYRENPPYAGTNAEDVGVFNYAYGGGYPTDLIAHDIPDDLWNPGREGLGFSATPSLLSSALDNYIPFGGFGFDVYKVGTTTFDEPYQIFTVSNPSTSGNFTDFGAGDYAGCPGSCRGAVVNPVPGPLPLLGVGAAFGFSRRIRSRIKGARLV